MSTDRELLELAAKAAGLNIVIKDIPHRTLFFGKETVCRIDDNPCKEWNPLDDDGDALRLRNKTRAILFNDGDAVVCRIESFAGTSAEALEIPDSYLPNGYSSQQSFDAATRRAIVRAAAEIGLNMKGETE